MAAREFSASAASPVPQAAIPAALRTALADRYATIGYAETLAGRDRASVRAMLDTHLALGLLRPPGTPVIGVYALHPPGEAPCTVLDVVTEDMPFLVDSLDIVLTRHGASPRAIAHPVLRARRDAAGTLQSLAGAPGSKATPGCLEAWMHFELPDVPETAYATLRDAAARTLAQVRLAVADWAAMRTRMLEIAALLERAPQPVAQEERAETVAFLHWLAQDNFTYLAAHEYALGTRADFDLLRPCPGTGLGLLRPAPAALDRRLDTLIPAALRPLARQRSLLVLTKSSAVSPVHRPAQMDYVGVRRFDARGRLRGEWRFLGLYTSSAYQTRPQDIPLLRRKVGQVLAAAGLPSGGHSMKALVHVLETFPREEMLQASVAELTEAALGVLAVQDRHRLRLFVRREVFGRFATALLYVPRERYRTELRETAQRLLLEALGGESAEFYTQFSEAAQVRVYFVIRLPPGATPAHDGAALEARLADAMLTWRDRFEALAAAQGFADAPRWADAFPPGYQADTTPEQALADLRALGTRAPGAALALELSDDPGGYRLRVRGEGEPPVLSDVLPPLEHFGVRVREARPYELRPAGAPAFVLDFELDAPDPVPAAQVHARFEEAFARVLAGDAEDDGLSRLVLAAGLDWREVTLARAILKHLLQLQIPFSQAYMEQCLARHGTLVRRMLDLHHLRFDPRARTGHAAQRAGLATAIGEALDAVASLDEDRILRHVHAHVQAMVRTNYFQRGADGAPKAYLAFKLDPHELPGIPEPRPYREIFVYAPQVEGVHLRGGLVARGGIRHSDRREDFRTEVLGLMKAQMVKNAVIVPVGAKGGFVVKRALPQERSARDAAVRACYATFIRGLLDLTDNRAGARVVPPRDGVRYDEDDPYLVVAADKGTAAFSDLANGIAAEYGYWLGDAFASGGRTGYDHKAMGITARGAWESVKRHFREIGLDYRTTPVTVAGIGDMSGDVFGNGMLYTDRIRLVAAFDHRHIFLDPDPDPARSYAERKRLYALPRSSWADYDSAAISPGGAVYPRTAKEIALTEPVRRALATTATRLAAPELIQAILRAPVDLLWNGGIGTYVKARTESHAEVGDRANDAVRVNGAELRCKVVGEGGNLGMTQFGRIEYARAGGRINTDAIDNSAGVDASDHEVNLKILLGAMERGGRLSRPSRNRLLRAMQGAVTEAVLADNYGQALTLSVETNQAPYLLAEHARLIRRLEGTGALRRHLEHLPSDAELDARAAEGGGLTRPELAVLLAHAKIALYGDLVRADLLADPELGPLLPLYFPPRLRRRYPRALPRHPLAREILATHLANHLVNRMGPTFTARVRDQVGADAPATARAAAIAARLFDLPGLWAQIERLDDTVPGALQVELLVDTRRLLERASAWLLRRPHEASPARRAGPRTVGALVAVLPGLLGEADTGALAQRTQALEKAGAPTALAGSVARLDLLYAALDVAALARWRATRVPAVAAAYFALADLLQAPWLRGAIRTLPRLHHFQRKARTALRDELYGQLARLAAEVLASRGADPAARLAAWRAGERRALRHYDAVLAEIRTGKGVDLAGLTVALGELRALGRE
jgi:glutamate dehydrogenase